MELIYKPSNCFPPRQGPIAFDGIQLKPGVNILSQAQSDKLTSHPDFDKYVSLKALVVKDADAEPALEGSLKDLSGYNVEEAEKLIDSTNDLSLLEQWLQAESRKTAKAALTQRIEDLQTAPA